MTPMETEKTELEGLDLFLLVRKFFLALRRFWALVLVLSLLGAGAMYWKSVASYSPRYKAEATPICLATVTTTIRPQPNW